MVALSLFRVLLLRYFLYKWLYLVDLFYSHKWLVIPMQTLTETGWILTLWVSNPSRKRSWPKPILTESSGLLPGLIHPRRQVANDSLAVLILPRTKYRQNIGAHLRHVYIVRSFPIVYEHEHRWTSKSPIYDGRRIYPPVSELNSTCCEPGFVVLRADEWVPYCGDSGEAGNNSRRPGKRTTAREMSRRLRGDIT